MKVSTVAEMREMDRRAISEFGIPDLVLMENAGNAAAGVILREIGIAAKTFLVFCGAGNNGGDGFVVARKILSNGGRVKVFLLSPMEKIGGISKINLHILDRLPVEVQTVESVEAIRSDVVHCDVIVDAILGTGLSKAVGGRYADVIGMINDSGKTIVSVDIPSGVNGDNGLVMGTAVKADMTVTFGLPKAGNLLYPGCACGGRLFVSHISFPPSLSRAASLKLAVNHPPQLPPRDPDGHKGTFGEALFIAGAASYFGAPYFAALAFMKAGGGYARLAAPRSMVPFLANKGSEIVFAPQEETSSGAIALANAERLLDMASQTDVVVIGPGLSLDPQTAELVRLLIGRVDRPLLLDGDGLTAVSHDADILTRRKAPTILTPHLGEMARMTRLSRDDIRRRRIQLLQQTCDRFKAHMVLKGGHSLIGCPDGRIHINMSGNSGMATAGTGDVLAGTIAAMTVLGLAVPDAVCKGVFIHGLAGDLAARALGEDGITAQDVLDRLPQALLMDREGLPQDIRRRYCGAVTV